jgi:anti-sigma factor RsiW
VQCEQLTDELAATSGDTKLLELEARTHLEGCLRCQAELAQYRKLLKALQQLRTEVLAPAPGLVTDVLVRLEERGERKAVKSILEGRKAAYITGIAAATMAAGGAAALVYTRRKLRVAAS